MGKSSPFATFLIIGPTCFFLGILFATFPYDYFVLWASPPASPPESLPFLMPADPTTTDPEALREPYLTLLEGHMKFLHAAPPLISRILHIAIGTGLVGLLTKLYKPTEANMLFDGASLVLYMCGIVVYISNIVKGMRVVTMGSYGIPGEDMMASRFASDNEAMAAAAASGGFAVPATDVDPAAALMGVDKPPVQILAREDSLKVLAASNTILALVLVGVLILQAGQWYAQRKEDAEIAEMDRLAKLKKQERGIAHGGSSAVSSEATGNREGAKKRQ